MPDTYLVTVTLMGASIALLTILMFVTRRPFTVINITVVLFMAALVSPMLIKLIDKGKLFPYIHAFEFFRAAPFTFGPLLFFYARAETGLMQRITGRNLFHFIPFAAAVIVMMMFGNPGNGLKPPSDVFPFLSVMIFISLTFYTVLIFRLIYIHNRVINDFFSSDSLEISLKWIKWITLCFLLSFLAVLADGLLMMRMKPEPFGLISLIPDMATTFFIFMFSFFSLKQPEIYHAVADDCTLDALETGTEKRYEKSGLKNDAAEIYYRQIIEFMASRKPYTDADFTIGTLSLKTGIPKHYITQVINERINRNFFMFINEYRIKEVIERLDKDVLNEHSILRIAYDAGFNSKSTFNNTFKKITGMTPSQYRKTVSSKQ